MTTATDNDTATGHQGAVLKGYSVLLRVLASALAVFMLVSWEEAEFLRTGMLAKILPTLLIIGLTIETYWRMRLAKVASTWSTGLMALSISAAVCSVVMSASGSTFGFLAFFIAIVSMFYLYMLYMYHTGPREPANAAA